LFLVFTLLTPFSAESQQGTEDNLAILHKGPIPGRGIPNLYPNAIPYFYGAYRFGSLLLDVYYSAEKIAPSESWAGLTCGKIRLFEVPAEEGRFFYYGSEAGWTIFLKIPPELENLCPFIEVFIRRLTYFIGINRDRGIVPFPAVLQVY